MGSKSDPARSSKTPTPLRPVGTAQAIRAAEAWFHRQIPPHVIVDGGGRIHHASEGTGRYLELQRGCPTADISAMLKPEIAERLERAVALATNEPQTIGPFRWERPNGAEWAWISVVPLPTAEGSLLVTFNRHDPPLPVEGDDAMEELQAANEEAAVLNEELAAANHQLLAANQELAETNSRLAHLNEEMGDFNRRLAEARDAADRANAAKSAFLANMSHEFRTPLNAILGFADAMQCRIWGGLDNPRYDEYAAAIHYSGTHLLQLVNEILDLAKVEAGHLSLDRKPLDPLEAIEEAVVLARQTAPEKAVVHNSAPNLPRLLADRRRLVEILLNLLANALAASPPDGTVSVTADVKSDNRLAIAIADQGCGMDVKEIAAALQPYAQLDSVYRRSHRGTGLGLPIAERLVRAHGGELIIRSEKGRGTCIEVLLPMAG